MLGSLLAGVGHTDSDRDSAIDLRNYSDTATYQFASRKPAFSVRYPASWRLAEFNAPMVHYVEARDRLPAMRVMVMDELWWLPLRFATRAAMTQLEALGRDVELVSESIEEWDGRRVNVGEVHWTMNMGLGLPLRTLFVSVYQDGKWIMLNLITGPHVGEGVGVFPQELIDVARTLRFADASEQ